MEFRLLVQVERTHHDSESVLSLEGRHWLVTEPYDISDWSAIPEYTCVSYVWGSGRTPHPLHRGFDISVNTLPSLAAAISSQPELGTAFWIDAFCIPTDRQKKQATLESMGFIYSRAKQVVVAFSGASYAAIDQITKSDRLDDHHLEVLNRDEWVKSVWTYQEVVNSQKLVCVCPDLPGSSTIDGSEFLNRVGFSLHLYKNRHGLGGFDLHDRFPQLSALEDLVADYMVAGYLERSALQVMSAMDLRVHRKPTHRLYAMIGAVTQKPSRSSTTATLAELAELFMAACEEKNDYSFIYSTAPRDMRPDKRWRPVPGCLPSILPWAGFGSGQRAFRDASSGCLWLEDVVSFQVQPQSVLTQLAKEIIVGWTGHKELVESDELLAEQLYTTLKRVGFSGSNRYAVVDDGLFFPLYDVHPVGVVLVATGVRWVFGAPGLLLQNTGQGIEYIPGVFAGSISVKEAGRALLT